MKTMLLDGACMGYIIAFALCVYGAILFLWGLTVAKKQGWHVSVFYLYVLALFTSIGYMKFMAIVSRYYTLTSPEMSYFYRQTFAWDTRTIPLIIVLGLIVGHMTYRAFWKRFE
jgi:hypothetical protein